MHLALRFWNGLVRSALVVNEHDSEAIPRSVNPWEEPIGAIPTSDDE